MELSLLTGTGLLALTIATHILGPLGLGSRVNRDVTAVKKFTEALEQVLDMQDLLLRWDDPLHERDDFLSKLDVVEPDKGCLIHHAIQDTLEEQRLIEKVLGIHCDGLGVWILLLFFLRSHL